MCNDIGIIIQARTGSSRLPNKMILPFYENTCILDILLNRLKLFIPDIPIIVATTNAENDGAIVEISKQNRMLCYRGSENDVLQRFIESADYFGIDKIIRICADNPFLDMKALRELIQQFSVVNCDYLAFSTSLGLPTIKTHYGFWTEAVKLAALKKIVSLTQESLFHEHVTNYIYTFPDLFKIHYIPIPLEIETKSNIRLTLDTIEDFNIQKDIFSVLMDKNKFFSTDEVISVLDAHPDYYEIMQKQININSK